MKLTVRPIEKWPGGKGGGQKNSPFFASYDQTLRLLDDELTRIGATNVVVQLDISESDIRIDGTLKAVKSPRSSRVILTFETKKIGAVQIPCDRFYGWKENLRAIALGLEALRKMDRYGITTRGEQYTGWKALPPASGITTTEAAATFIEQHSNIHEAKIRSDAAHFWTGYKQAAKKLHPDAGGDREQWEQLSRARDVLERHFGA